MFTTTFYSFKGGVGRTLALVNVAMQLAKTGRRVLIVDFDLEAPGIDTIQDLAHKDHAIGIVDFVTDYIETSEVPDVRNYLYEVSLAGKAPGRIWVMPAGKRDNGYAERLAAINWQKLYSDLDGFLLFDDLKRQWEEKIRPDYVLIDSRTGHTEVKGISTRQLPDAVVVLFIPNEQNLRGLEQVVAEIRTEKSRPEDKAVELLFVVSSVPNIDDEDDILQKQLTRFAKRLNYLEPDAIIHRYDSLSLLNQAVFVIDRPKSRLAKEYATLTNSIMARNLEDREGAIDFLRKRPIHRGRTSLEMEKKNLHFVEKIRNLHATDPDVLYDVFKFLNRLGRSEEALLTLDQAIEASRLRSEPVNINLLLARAETLRSRGDIDLIADLEEILKRPEVDLNRLRRTINLLSSIDPNRLIGIEDRSAIRTLDSIGQVELSTSILQHTRQGQTVASAMLQRTLDANRSLSPEIRNAVVNELVLSNIGLGRFETAIELTGAEREELDRLDLRNCFNYAMAEWGRTNKPPERAFARVIELDRLAPTGSSGANYNQCLSVSLGVLGNTRDAMGRLELAKEAVEQTMNVQFSCWSYLLMSPKLFLSDIDQIRQFLSGEPVRPRFIYDRDEGPRYSK